MKEEFNKPKIEQLVRALLVELGDDPNRPGLIETPKRVAKAVCELFDGMRYSNDEIAERYNKCFEEAAGGNMVVVKDIPLFSFCEHHLMLMYNMHAHIAYVPKDRVIGLSKISRVVTMVGKRLQLQERIGSDILDVLMKILKTEDIAVVIEGEHSCMTARGIRSMGSKTRTANLSGIFKEKAETRNEFYNLIEK